MEAAGAQRVAYELHRGLLARGHESELWFLYTKRPAYVGRPGVRSLFDCHASLSDYPGISRSLFRDLRRYKPDAVVTHTHYANVLGQSAAFVAGISKRIAVHHNAVSTFPTAARLADRFLGRVGIYSKIVGISECVHESALHYPRRYVRRICCIPNGVGCSSWDADKDVRAVWGIPQNSPLLLSVGRLSQQKNHFRLLNALNLIPDARLVIVGDGELSAEIRQQVDRLMLRERVVLTGEIAQERVYELMNSADVFVFPSLWEGLSLAALEALTMGMATVASDIPANREAFGGAAIFVPATDVTAIAAGITRVIHDADLAKQLRANARERAKLFSLDEMIDRYELLLCGEEGEDSTAQTTTRHSRIAMRKRWKPDVDL
jgi:glycosyltransferase involved in cell wall biosynthesis